MNILVSYKRYRNGIKKLSIENLSMKEVLERMTETTEKIDRELRKTGKSGGSGSAED